MESDQVEVRASLPSLASLDEEFGGPNKPVVPEQDYQRRHRRYVWFLLASAALGMTSIVLWPNNALRVWSLAQSLPSSPAEQAASQISAGSAEPREELDALKKEISELRDWRQQISAEITALQSAHQELQRSSVKVISWYSEPNALLHQPAAPKPRTSALRSGRATTQTRPAMQEADAEPRNATVPYPLERSQTTGPDDIPIR
jgi:TolA-binding protein